MCAKRNGQISQPLYPPVLCNVGEIGLLTKSSCENISNKSVPVKKLIIFRFIHSAHTDLVVA